MSFIKKTIAIMLIASVWTSCRHATAETDSMSTSIEPTVGPGPEGAITECKSVRREPLLIEDFPNPFNIQRFRAGALSNFEFRGVTLYDALSEISRAYSVPIIIDSDEAMSTEVSAFIMQASFLDTLEVILQPTRLTYSYNGRYFYIGELDAKNPESVSKLTYNHQYRSRSVQPELLVSMISSVYKEYIKPVKEMDLVAISAPLPMIYRIISALSSLDTPTDQILLKLNIIEIEKTQLTRFGHYMSSMATVGGALNGLSPVIPAVGHAVLSRQAAMSFLSTVDALSGEGAAKVMAAPKIITKNGENAEFKSVEALYLPSATINNNGGASRGVAKIDTALEFVITPYLRSTEEIYLDIGKAKIGLLDIDENNTPHVKEHSVKTKVTVRPGETILLGGMIGSKSKEMIYGVPYLKDIPFLGWLFKSKRSEVREVEIFFTITPEVLCY